MIGSLHDKLIADKDLESTARTSNFEILIRKRLPCCIWDGGYGNFMNSHDSYSSLFENQAKYNAVMSALARANYQEMNQNKI